MNRSLPLVLLLAFMAGCAGQARQAPSPENGWGLGGRVALWAHGDQDSANIDWQDCGDRYLIRLSGPIGIGTSLIYGNRDGVWLYRGGEPELSAASPEALLAEQGWRLPVSALRHWLRGLPVPDAPYQRSPQDSGQIERLRQLGWDIHYEYASGAPVRIAMENPEIRLKWLIRQWRDSAECPRP